MTQKGTAFLITVDCEADDEWSRPSRPSYRGIFALKDFQALCERFGAQPTYLVTYDVAEEPVSRDVLTGLSVMGHCEIGAHLHAWRTPPFHPELDEDPGVTPYLHEYPEEYRTAKLRCLTDRITEAFGVRPRSYRGGRWSLDDITLDGLLELRYVADTTVTPLMSWELKRGARERGLSYVEHPLEPHIIRQVPGDKADRRLLEVPVTVRILGSLSTRQYVWCAQWAGKSFFRWVLIRKGLWLSGLARSVMMNPVYTSCMDLRQLVDQVCASEGGVVNMAFHSSELVPGGCPRVPNDESARDVWKRLEHVLEHASTDRAVQFCTLSEFAEQWLGTRIESRSV